MVGTIAATSSSHPWERVYPPGIDWRTPIPARPLWEILDEAVARHGGRPCLDFLDRRWTYAEVGQLVDRTARGFQELGVVKGTRVGLCLPNTPWSVAAYFGALKAGAVVVNYNPLYAEAELQSQIDDSGTEIMVTVDLAAIHPKLTLMLERTRSLRRLVVCRLADALPFPKNILFPILKRHDIARVPWGERHVPFRRLVANDGAFRPVKVDPERDVAVLQYTGGTTGVPKGAMLTHANLHANAVQAAMWFPGAQPGQERLLAVLPFFHVFAMTVAMNLGLRLGAELILLPRFDLDQVMRTIDAKRPSLFPAVPTIYTAINTHKERDRYDLSSIRYCISGGAPLPVEVKMAFERNTGCKLVEGYGLTEAAPVTNCNPLEGVNKAGSIGLPLPGTMVEIVSLEDRVTVLPPGGKGEVCIRGPQVMAGYWNRPDETALTLDGGRLHTGDVGIMDEDGYVFIVDRIKDMILCGGYNVYPRNVEEAIYRHPDVAECVVVGIPDDYRGQTVKAFIRRMDGTSLTQRELCDFLTDKLSPIEMPKVVEFRDELPKTMIGKLSRKALLEEEERRRQAREQMGRER
ncbi:MAG TPA: long-chain fatty acid--CoA ligase [Azospirillaceae bacterium]|nr:long-chain fatty acid--CoA ligase [Azospirillaceae bacterium]